MQVTQRLADRVVELRLGEHQQRRLRRRRGRREVLGEGALGHQLQQGVHRDPPEVVGEQPVAAAAHHEVGADRARQIGSGEVGVPPLRLGQREEVPGQVRGAQIALHRQDRRGVEGRGRALVGLPIDDEPGLGDRLARPGRSVPLRVVPGRAGAGVGRDVLGRMLGSGPAGRGSHRSTPSWPRTTKKPSGCRSHHRAAIAADASPSQARTRSRIASRSSGPCRLGILLAPDVPVHRRHDAGKAAEQVLGVGDRPLLLLAPGRLQATVDVAADRRGTPAGSRRGHASAGRPPGRRGPGRAGTPPPAPTPRRTAPAAR